MHKKLFTKSECDEIVSFAEDQDRWQTINDSAKYQIIIFQPNEYISNKIIKYGKERLGLSILTVNLAVIKYLEGDHFPRHIDRNKEYEFNKDFVYNINIKLNDEYEGGEFFLNDELFVAEVGDVYHYKSTEFHEVKTITKGVRYSGLFYVRERDLGVSKII
jgi:predicted 2-oxoglutarate/Fe(II)-dependent dioxygenase YbiX